MIRDVMNNVMSDAEILAVVKAHMEGKLIEFRHPGNEWTLCADNRPCWEFARIEYRVAPAKPEVQEVPVHPPDNIADFWHAHIPVNASSGTNVYCMRLSSAIDHGYCYVYDDGVESMHPMKVCGGKFVYPVKVRKI